MRRWFAKRKVWLTLLCLLLAYVTSYVVLSRRGIAFSQRVGCEGFWFFPPDGTNTWRLMNYGCVCFYYPLIVIDNWIGTGRPAACEPTRRLVYSGDARRVDAAAKRIGGVPGP
jgi:hypothetical protein